MPAETIIPAADTPAWSSHLLECHLSLSLVGIFVLNFAATQYILVCLRSQSFLALAARTNLHFKNMASVGLFRVILPDSSIEDAAVFYSPCWGSQEFESLLGAIISGVAVPSSHASIRRQMATPGTRGRIQTIFTSRWTISMSTIGA